ncbi:hypothetical protein ABIF96_005917 [Bradyrhizobium ottawaense]
MPPAFVEMLPPIWQEPSAPQAQGKIAIDVARRVLHLSEDAAGFHCDRVREWADVADGAHPVEPDHHIAGPIVRRRRPAHAGVASLRHDRELPCRTEFDDGGDLGGGAGLHHRDRAAVITPAPVYDVGFLVSSGRNDVLVADDRGKPGERVLEGV